MQSKDINTLRELYQKLICEAREVIYDDDNHEQQLDFAYHAKEVATEAERIKILDSQYDLIKKFFDKDLADSANYGWYTDETTVSTKIYTPDPHTGDRYTSLTSAIDDRNGKVMHIIPGGDRNKLPDKSEQMFGGMLDAI
jgi:hypothetical protein